MPCRKERGESVGAFRVKTAAFSQAAGDLTSMKKKLSTIGSELTTAKRAVQWSIGTRAGINNRLNQIANRLQDEEKAVGGLSSTINQILLEYQTAEQKLNSKKGIRVTIQNASGVGTASGDGGAVGSRDGSDSEKSWAAKLKEAIDTITGGHSLISDIFNTEGGKKGREGLGLISGLAGYVDKLDKFIHSKPGDVVENGLDWGKSFSSLTSKLYNWVDAKGMADGTGLISSFLGVVLEGTKASGRTISEQLKNSGGVITAGSKLAQSIWKLSDDGKYEAWLLKNATKKEQYLSKWGKKADLAAISSLFNMATYSVGDVIERSKDGVYDLNDYGKTLLDTGITGMGSLTSGLTGGLVKVDTKRSGYIFDYTIEKTQDWIKDTAGDSMFGRALLLPAGAVYATATGICGTFIDCGIQIGESIKKIFYGKDYTPNASMEYQRYILEREGAYGFGYSSKGGGGIR